MVIVRYGAANRDEDMWGDAGEFDLDRPNLNQHMGFGTGPHYCVGAALARQELLSGFGTWLAGTSSIELADPGAGPTPEASFLLLPIAELRLRAAPA